jgi:predicted nucleotidyltransferase
MGSKKTRSHDGATGLASALFSTVQRRVLGRIFSDPDRSYYQSEIVRDLRSGTGAVARELERLERSGLVLVKRIGNQKHYRANKTSPIFHELHGIVQKTVGLHDPLREALAPWLDRIELAFVYGSVAKGTDTARSDIDLMIVGDNLTYSDLYAGLQKAEEQLSRPVNPTVMERGAWRKRRKGGSPFLQKVLQQPKIFIVGSGADLSDDGSSG